MIFYYRKFFVYSYLDSFMNIVIVQKMNLQYKKLKKYYSHLLLFLDVCT